MGGCGDCVAAAVESVVQAGERGVQPPETAAGDLGGRGREEEHG